MNLIDLKHLFQTCKFLSCQGPAETILPLISFNLTSKYKPIVRVLKNYNFKFKRKIWTWTGIWISDIQISSLALYHSSYPGSIGGTGLRRSQQRDLDQYRQLNEGSSSCRAPG